MKILCAQRFARVVTFVLDKIRSKFLHASFPSFNRENRGKNILSPRTERVSDIHQHHSSGFFRQNQTTKLQTSQCRRFFVRRLRNRRWTIFLAILDLPYSLPFPPLFRHLLRNSAESSLETRRGLPLFRISPRVRGLLSPAPSLPSLL